MKKVTQSQFVETVMQYTHSHYCVVEFCSIYITAYTAFDDPFFCKASNHKSRKSIFDRISQSSYVGIIDSFGDVMPP